MLVFQLLYTLHYTYCPEAGYSDLNHLLWSICSFNLTGVGDN